MTSEDVRRLWSEYLHQVLPPCPWTAFWKPSPLTKPTPNSSVTTGEPEVNQFVDVIKVTNFPGAHAYPLNQFDKFLLGLLE